MPIVDGEEVLEVTAAQLDEIIFNVSYGSVDYSALEPTTVALFTNKVVAVSTTETSTGTPTGNTAKMIITFSQTGASTNCTMDLYGSENENLSNAGIIATLTLGYNETPARIAIDPIAIPGYTNCECTNNDPTNSATCTVSVTTWN